MRKHGSIWIAGLTRQNLAVFSDDNNSYKKACAEAIVSVKYLDSTDVLINYAL